MSRAVCVYCVVSTTPSGPLNRTETTLKLAGAFRLPSLLPPKDSLKREVAKQASCALLAATVVVVVRAVVVKTPRENCLLAPGLAFARHNASSSPPPPPLTTKADTPTNTTIERGLLQHTHKQQQEHHYTAATKPWAKTVSGTTTVAAALLQRTYAHFAFAGRGGRGRINFPATASMR